MLIERNILTDSGYGRSYGNRERKKDDTPGILGPPLSQSKINWIRNATSFYSVQKTGQSGFQLSFEHGIYLCRIRLTLRGFHNLTNE